MESLELQGKSSTLVDLVEEKLQQYLKENDYCIGSKDEVRFNAYLKKIREHIK